MEETKKLYESMVVISCKCGGDGISAIVDKLKKLIEDEESAELTSFNEWGKRKLAYLINKESEAYYVVFNFVSDSKFPAEFSRICRITDGILRSVVLKCISKKKKERKKVLKKSSSEIENSVEGSVEENSESNDVEPSSFSEVSSAPEQFSEGV